MFSCQFFAVTGCWIRDLAASLKNTACQLSEVYVAYDAQAIY